MKQITLKRLSALLSINMILIILLASCGIDQNDYDTMMAERDSIQGQYAESRNEYDLLKAEYDILLEEHASFQDEYSKTKEDYDSLKKDYDTLLADTADWLKLSEEEQAAQLAQAETERIAAEAEAEQAAEEKAAADAKAAEEAAQKEAEEAALKAEEEKKGYNTGITFSDISRNPDDFEGKKLSFKGEVLQVTELTDEIQIRLATKVNSWGGYSDDVIYIYFDSSLITSRILEEDIITVYGVSRGLHSYTTVLGASVTLPLVEVDRVDP